MHKQNGLLDSDFILSIRHELHRSAKKDLVIKETTAELLQEKTLRSEERYIVIEAQKEVKKRLYYNSLLDSLWSEIEEIQYILSKLHTYESLEKYQHINTKNDENEDNIYYKEILELDDIDFKETEDLYNELNDLEENSDKDLEENLDVDDDDQDLESHSPKNFKVDTDDDPDDEPDIFNDAAYLFDEDDEDDDEDFSYKQLSHQKQNLLNTGEDKKTKDKKDKKKKKDEKDLEKKEKKKKKDKKKKNKNRKKKLKQYEELLAEYRAANDRLMLKYLEYKEEKLKKKEKKDKKKQSLDIANQELSSENIETREIRKLY